MCCEIEKVGKLLDQRKEREMDFFKKKTGKSMADRDEYYEDGIRCLEDLMK